MTRLHQSPCRINGEERGATFRNEAGYPIRQVRGAYPLPCPNHCVRKLGKESARKEIIRERRLMKRVVSDELVPGMTLSKAVTNANGLPIVAVGTILDSSMIERLQRLGLNSVYVEGDAEDTGGKTLTELEAELEHRFRRVAHDPAQQIILQTLRKHLHATHSTAPVAEEPAIE